MEGRNFFTMNKKVEINLMWDFGEVNIKKMMVESIFLPLFMEKHKENSQVMVHLMLSGGNLHSSWLEITITT